MDLGQACCPAGGTGGGDQKENMEGADKKDEDKVSVSFVYALDMSKKMVKKSIAIL